MQTNDLVIEVGQPVHALELVVFKRSCEDVWLRPLFFRLGCRHQCRRQQRGPTLRASKLTCPLLFLFERIPHILLNFIFQYFTIIYTKMFKQQNFKDSALRLQLSQLKILTYSRKTFLLSLFAERNLIAVTRFDTYRN